MSFNSLDFVFFLIAVAGFYFLLPHRYRWVLLLASSYFFYMCWKAEYVVLIMISTAVDYYAGIQMGKCAERSGRLKYLLASLGCNLGLLFSFKYFNFFNESLRAIFGRFDLPYDIPALDVLLPVGISFYTFQTLSYSIDVYRGVKEPERHFGVFAVYVAFFPQLVAGPIERATHFLPQFHRRYDVDYERIRDGLRLILWGMFKKVVVADRVAIYVDNVYNNAYFHDSGLTFLVATYFFAFQIYCDFSAYSDIAIGSARILGFDLMLNFRTPYFSRSVGEFWQRWHISLSTWFRDYLYIPLGGNRVVKWRWYFNLMAVFLVSGLWHGANWTFVVWGGLHGVYLVVGLLTGGLRQRVGECWGQGLGQRVRQLLQVIFTFHLVCVGWIFFRANSLSDAAHIVKGIFFGAWNGLHIGNSSQFVYAVIAVGMLLAVEVFMRGAVPEKAIGNLPMPWRWVFYLGCVMAIMLIGVFDGGQFIYFQF